MTVLIETLFNAIIVLYFFSLFEYYHDCKISICSNFDCKYCKTLLSYRKEPYINKVLLLLLLLLLLLRGNKLYIVHECSDLLLECNILIWLFWVKKLQITA